MSIKLSGLHKSYGKHQVLKDINLELRENSILSVVGPNGSGKTTLVRCLGTLLLYDSGQINFFGETFSYAKYPSFRKQISLLLTGENSLYLNLTVMENIKYFLQLKGTDYKKKRIAIDEYVREFDIETYRNQLVSTLSKGTMLKVAIIIALLQESRLMILDEPTLGLDLESMTTLKRILKRDSKNRTILLTSHDVKLVEDVADDIAILDNGWVKFSGSLQSFNSMFDSVVLSIYVDAEIPLTLREQCHALSHYVQFDSHSIHGSFPKANIHALFCVVIASGLQVMDMKTHGTFEKNLHAVLGKELIYAEFAQN